MITAQRLEFIVVYQLAFDGVDFKPTKKYIMQSLKDYFICHGSEGCGDFNYDSLCLDEVELEKLIKQAREIVMQLYPIAYLKVAVGNK